MASPPADTGIVSAQGQPILLRKCAVKHIQTPPAVMVWKITNGDKEWIRKLEVADGLPEEVKHLHIMESSALFPVYSLVNAISTLTL